MKVTINENEYGLQWGLGALEIYQEAMEASLGVSLGMEEALDLAVMKNRDQTKALVNLALAGMRNYAEVNDLSFDLTYRKLQAWASEAEQKEWDAVIEDFTKSKFFGRTISEVLGGTTEDTSKTKKKSASAK
jgi:hypothetical protein